MNVLIIGETCNDKFVYGKVERICPEAPVPVFRPYKETNHLGMAANVLANIKAIAEEHEDNESSFHILTNTCKGSKTRYVDSVSNQMLMRLDDEEYFSDKSVRNIDFSKYDAVIVSDYDKGFLSLDDLSFIAEECNKQYKYIMTFLDTKKNIQNNPYSISGYDFIKINNKEYIENGFYKHKHVFHDHLIVTRGSEGCMVDDKFYPCQATQVFDVSGAGDTFLAAFAYKYILESHLEESINYAQQCCAKVVAKKGVCTI